MLLSARVARDTRPRRVRRKQRSPGHHTTGELRTARGANRAPVFVEKLIL